jgi:DNA repair protein RAD50
VLGMWHVMRRDTRFTAICHISRLILSLLSSCTMSTLDKLVIRGIRSFDDKSISVIQFRPPVTVIVGHNGSGKTTIIECLKYATTGDQPPGTRGGAFIHDPTIANEKEVKAQVKLRFRAADGRRIIAVRNLSVTKKKTAGLTMKTLESILAIDNEDGDNSGKVRYSDVKTPSP